MEQENLLITLHNTCISDSTKSGLVLDIINTTNSTIKLRNPRKISIKDLPTISDATSNSDVDTLYIYFNYGKETGHLCTTENAVNIKCEINNKRWNIVGREDENWHYCWIAAPLEDYEFKSGECLRITINNIIPNKTAGFTTLHLDYTRDINEEEYFSESFIINKLPTPKKKVFKIKEETYNYGDTVTLMWEIENLIMGEAWLDGSPIEPLGEKQFVANNENFKHELAFRNRAGTFIKEKLELTFGEAEIIEFELKPSKKEEFAYRDNQKVIAFTEFKLTWSTKNVTDTMILPHIGRVPANGSFTIKSSELQPRYFLQGVKAASAELFTKELPVKCPIVNAFQIGFEKLSSTSSTRKAEMFVFVSLGNYNLIPTAFIHFDYTLADKSIKDLTGYSIGHKAIFHFPQKTIIKFKLFAYHKNTKELILVKEFEDFKV